jgi:hypothetical protein
MGAGHCLSERGRGRAGAFCFLEGVMAGDRGTRGDDGGREVEGQWPERWQCAKCGCSYEGDLVRHAVSLERLRQRSGKRVCPNTEAPLVPGRVCKPCRNYTRFLKGRGDPFLLKARETRRRHARELEIPVRVLILRHEWTDANIVKALRRAWEEECPDCTMAYKEMKGGMAEMTVDVIDRRLPPDWLTNCRIICRDDNSAKGKMPPEEWALHKAVWRMWKGHNAEHPRPKKLTFLRLLGLEEGLGEA